MMSLAFRLYILQRYGNLRLLLLGFNDNLSLSIVIGKIAMLTWRTSNVYRCFDSITWHAEPITITHIVVEAMIQWLPYVRV